MPDKIDFKKTDKHLYKPSAKKPSIVDVPELPYLMVDGTGNPNGEDFQQAVEALYGLSYKIKMSPKKNMAPEGYFDYVVAPLTGIWDVKEGETFDKNNKDVLKWTIMIRQPDFVTSDFLETIRQTFFAGDDNPFIAKVRLSTAKDGLSCQMLHVGPFDTETETFEKMEAWCAENGYRRTAMNHREIYLSNFNRTAPEKLKTVLRFSVEAV